MIIILCLYIVALWLVFSKFKLVRWGWLSGTVSVLIGVFILATFLALFNYLTPSGRVTVTGRVVEVTPNYDQASANVVGLTAQVAFNAKRLGDIQKLAAEDANTQFQAQDRQNQYETALAQLNVAKAAQQSAKLALDSEIGGVNTTVAQIQAQLDNASWELSQTAIRAPADGYVTLVTLSVGDRALQARSAMSFIVENEITLVGMFSQNGFQTIKDGASVDIVFDNAPGRIYHAKITAIPKGVGQGQVAVSGTLARTNAIGGASAFPAEISVPDQMSRDALRLGMSGNATAFAENAGVIGLLASILVWISAYTAYL